MSLAHLLLLHLLFEANGSGAFCSAFILAALTSGIVPLLLFSTAVAPARVADLGGVRRHLAMRLRAQSLLQPMRLTSAAAALGAVQRLLALSEQPVHGLAQQHAWRRDAALALHALRHHRGTAFDAATLDRLAYALRDVHRHRSPQLLPTPLQQQLWAQVRDRALGLRAPAGPSADLVCWSARAGHCSDVLLQRALQHALDDDDDDDDGAQQDRVARLVAACARVRHRPAHLLAAVAARLAADAARFPPAALVRLLHAFAELRFAHAAAVPAACAALLRTPAPLPRGTAAGTLWALARLRVRDAPLQQRLEEQLGDADEHNALPPRYVGNAMWALGVLRARRACTLPLLARRMNALLWRSDPRTLASCCWALATSGTAGFDELFGSVAAQVRDRVCQWRSTASVATLLWSFASYGVVDRALFAAAAKALVADDRLRAFKPADLLSVAWAFARAPPDTAGAVALFRALGDAAVAAVKGFALDELAALVWQYAEADVAHARLVEAAVGRLCAPSQLVRLGVHELSLLASSCARLRLQTTQLPLLTQVCVERAEQLEPAAVARLVGAIGTLSCKQSSLLLPPLLAHIDVNFANWFASDLSALAVGLARFNEEYSSLVGNSLTRLSLGGQHRHLSAKALLEVAEAIFLHRYDSTTWLFQRRLVHLAPSMSCDHLANIIFLLAKAGVLTRRACVDLEPLLVSRAHEFSTARLVRIAWAFMSVQLPLPFASSSFWRVLQTLDSSFSCDDSWRVHELYLSHCLERRLPLKRVQFSEPPADGGKTSGWKLDAIASLLKQLPSGKAAFVCPLSGYSIDVALPNSKHAFLLLDDCCFGRKNQQPNGVVGVKRQLLERVGWTVVWIPQRWVDQSSTR